MYKTLIILFLCLSACSLKTSDRDIVLKVGRRTELRKYFKRNKNNVDLLEGIWYEYAVKGSLYKDRLLLQRIREPNRATWIIIKDKDSKRYNVLNANGKDNYFNAFLSPQKIKILIPLIAILRVPKQRFLLLQNCR